MAYFSTVFIAVLPFIEAKGAIPFGMSLGLSPLASFVCSYVGSMLPVPILLSLIIPLLKYLNTSKKFKKLNDKLRKYIDNKSSRIKGQNMVDNSVQKPLKSLALFTFVALPLPGTGVWSGSLVAGALNVKKLQAFAVIAFANLFASAIIFLVSFGFFI
jgi:uncharacterized membrane protein